MTYKEIVDRFEQTANQHYMIKDFGYGQLSDIKVHSQDDEADYPYMFLNPTPHTREGVIMTYNFNMIMMDIATDEDDDHSNWMAIQSKCQQYIDDVIAQLYYGYTDKPQIDYSNISYTPFKERFQDSVAGMTATISIDVPVPLNQCDAPIRTEEVLVNLNTNIPECTQDFFQAFVDNQDFVNFPQYTKQDDTFRILQFIKEPFTDCDGRKTLDAINEYQSTEQIYYDGISRKIVIPQGVEGVYELKYTMELTNVQGLDLSQDEMELYTFINGQRVSTSYRALPDLPINGDVVPFTYKFLVTGNQSVDQIDIRFGFKDNAPLQPAGPIVGYKGNLTITKQ